MKSDFLLAVNQICAERNLPREVVLQAIEAALIQAYKRDYGLTQNISVKLDPATGIARVYAAKKVAEQPKDGRLEMSLLEAKCLEPGAEMGDTIQVEVTPRDFGRIAAQSAKQVILQRIREAERDALYMTYAEQEGEIVNGTVRSIEPQAVIVSLGRAEGILPPREQIPGERYYINQRLRAHVSEVRKGGRGPEIWLSRASRHMLERLLELEVPEIHNGLVEVKAIAREAGSRSKVAVAALREGIDPVGACVGMRGTRIQSVVSELNGEKIDVVAWNQDYALFIANALSPAQVISVELDQDNESGKTARVVVPDKQLSLAIGKEGQNARLAAKLTNWRIDIRSATEAAREELRRAEEKAEAQAAEEARRAQEETVLAAARELLAQAERVMGLGELPVPAIQAEPQALPPVPEAPPEEEKAAPPVVEPALEVAVEEALAAESDLGPGEEMEWLEEEGEAGEPYAKPQDKGKRRQRGRIMVYDEELGKVVVKRVRKRSGTGRDWETETDA